MSMYRNSVRQMRVEKTRSEKIEGERWGYRTVPDGHVVGDIFIEIDIDAMVKTMGRKALLSKSRKCVDGFVTVKAAGVRHEVAV